MMMTDVTSMMPLLGRVGKDTIDRECQLGKTRRIWECLGRKVAVVDRRSSGKRTRWTDDWGRKDLADREGLEVVGRKTVVDRRSVVESNNRRSRISFRRFLCRIHLLAPCRWPDKKKRRWQ